MPEPTTVASAADAEGPRSRVDLDSIMGELGQWGPFQWRLMLLSAVASMMAAWTSEYIFTTARIKTRCYIPECDSEPPQFRPEWVWWAVPDAGGEPDHCRRFAPNASAAAGACSPLLFDAGSTQPCTHYVYESTDSIVYDFGLACAEWRRALVGAARTAGNLLALPLAGLLADRCGRRAAVLLSTAFSASVGLLRYWAHSYTFFIVSHVVESTLGSGAYTILYILLVESMNEKYRTICAAIYMSFWATGTTGHLGLIAWAVPNWRDLTLVLYLPQFICITYYWLVPEFARWHLSRGNVREAQAVLQMIAKENGTTLSAKSMAALDRLAEEQLRLKEKDKYSKEPWLVVSVFRHKQILLRCLVAPFWWVSTTFIYYGLSINAVNMVGNGYLNFVLVSAVEIPGFWTAVLLMDRAGRRPVLLAAYWLCAACQLAYIFMPADHAAALLAVYLVGKYCIAVVFKTLYMYTAELFPTRHRNTLFSYTSMVGRLGSIVAPLTPALGAARGALPGAVFAACALLSGCLLLLTPETRGAALPDTMQDADHLAKNSHAVEQPHTSFEHTEESLGA